MELLFIYLKNHYLSCWNTELCVAGIVESSLPVVYDMPQPSMEPTSLQGFWKPQVEEEASPIGTSLCPSQAAMMGGKLSETGWNKYQCQTTGTEFRIEQSV
jgi:hypothetical protein